MRDLDLAPGARWEHAVRHSPEFVPGADGKIRGLYVDWDTVDGAAYHYRSCGPLPEATKPRNAVVRAALKAAWPGVRFRVCQGFAGHAGIHWFDGPTERQVEDFCWTLEDLTPVQAALAQTNRKLTLRAKALTWLRTGDFRDAAVTDFAAAVETDQLVADATLQLMEVDPSAQSPHPISLREFGEQLAYLAPAVRDAYLTP